jgi:hypothetical protein
VATVNRHPSAVHQHSEEPIAAAAAAVNLLCSVLRKR